MEFIRTIMKKVESDNKARSSSATDAGYANVTKLDLRDIMGKARRNSHRKRLVLTSTAPS